MRQAPGKRRLQLSRRAGKKADEQAHQTGVRCWCRAEKPLKHKSLHKAGGLSRLQGARLQEGGQRTQHRLEGRRRAEIPRRESSPELCCPHLWYSERQCHTTDKSVPELQLLQRMLEAPPLARLATVEEDAQRCSRQ